MTPSGALAPMRLKQIILHGFKSFADRTVFRLEGRGMTCIVGPNGCGKSNVIDATKWILGEQRPTSLRGKEMTDVIFNGTVRRPPMGMCEGTLVFDNRSRTLGLDEDEVRVTRRVFRSGETEYMVNGRPSRLKDVRDLMAGTGLGHGGYAFMEQGKIDSILASNAMERRKVFEEASGISKFRTRKREAELKLVRVEDNLTRLGDIVEEIERQIRSLKIQAGKARNHREMTDRVRDLQLRWNRHRYVEILAERSSLDGEVAAMLTHREDQESERNALREAVREIETQLENLHEQVSQSRSELTAIQGQQRNVAERIEVAEERLSEARERQAMRADEIAALGERRAALEQDRVLTRREGESLQRDAGQITARRQSRDEEVGKIRARTQDLRAESQEAEKGVRAAEAVVHDLSRQLARLEADKTHAASRLAALEKRQAGVLAEREQLQAGLGERHGRQETQTSALEERRLALTEEERRSEALDSAFARALEEAGEVEAELNRRRTRREVLKGVLEKGEGLDHGTRRMLEHRGENPTFMLGFQGLLLDLFETDVENARAVEAALGDLASAIVVSSVADIREGLRFLEEQNLGGVRFLALDRFASDTDETLPVGIASAKEVVRSLLNGVLGELDIIPADRLDACLTDGSSGPFVVTTDGFVLRDRHVLEVPKRGGAAPGLVVLQAELRELAKVIPIEEGHLERARARLSATRAEREQSRTRVKELSVALLKEEGEAARLDQEIVRILNESERLDTESEQLMLEVQRTKDGVEDTRQKTEALNDAQKKADAARVQAEEELERRRARLLEETRVLEESQRDLAQLRVEETRVSERLEALSGRESQIDEAIRIAEQRLNAAKDEIEVLCADTERLSGTIDEGVAERERLQSEVETATSVVTDREASAASVREGLRERTHRLEELETSVTALADRIAGRKGREGELKAAFDGLLERTREELEVEPSELFAGLEGAEHSPEETPEGGWVVVEREIKDLKGRIARLGNVNLAAVEELDEAEERSSFLFRERGDLEDARDQLRKILKDIEARSSGLFLETFNAVREHFTEIFRRLFGGGKAEIFLEDENNPLESGIEIRARPPGKELRSITLLSGGERTMTAVALLFAIFRSNPAPCAFLDEVDAALDEDNIDRFCALLDEFVEGSQFVVVTHSRRTMERGDLLLGVTMPERGVSRPVAVELQQVADDGSISADAAARAAAAQAEDDAEGMAPVESTDATGSPRDEPSASERSVAPDEAETVPSDASAKGSGRSRRAPRAKGRDMRLEAPAIAHKARVAEAPLNEERIEAPVIAHRAAQADDSERAADNETSSPDAPATLFREPRDDDATVE